MSNSIRRLVTEDYDVMKAWGKFWRFPMPPRDYLPANGLGGVMITDEQGVNLCAGFIFFTNSKSCWIGPLISNPGVRDRDKRNEMMSDLIDSLSIYAKANGMKYCQTVASNPNLVNQYLDNGFTKFSRNIYELIKIL